MRLWGVIAAVMTVPGLAAGCGSSRRNESPFGPESTTGEGGSGGGVEVNAGAGGIRNGESIELSFHAFTGRSPLRAPATGAHIRVDGAGSTVEGIVDADGRVEVEVSADTGPWDVTFALAEHIPISILGVTDSIEDPVTLQPISTVLPSATVRLTGAVVGRASATSDIAVASRSVSSYWVDGDAYWALVRPPVTGSSLRLMIVEREDESPLSRISNAAWLDVPWTGNDARADIVLPSRPRTAVSKTLFVDAPRTGIVTADAVEPPPMTTVSHGIEGVGFPVGVAEVTREADEDGRFAVRVDALDGDMAPTRLSTTLADAEGVSQVLATTTEIEDDRVLTVPPADSLELAGSTIENLTLTWSAPEHTHVGASLHRAERPGSWFIYSYDAPTSARRPWPRLPSSVSLEDVSLNADAALVVYVFALSLPQGKVPWEWENGTDDQRAVLRQFGQFAEPPVGTGGSGGTAGAGGGAGSGGTPGDGGSGEGEGGDDGGGPSEPMFPDEGVYSLDEVRFDAMSCTDQGMSVIDAETQRLFFLMYESGVPYVGTCTDASDCREKVTHARDLGWVNGSNWAYHLNVPYSGLSSWADLGVYMPPETDGFCRHRIEESARLVDATAPSIRFDIFIRDVPDYPSSAGDCTAQGAGNALEGVDCSRRKAVFGTYLEAL